MHPSIIYHDCFGKSSRTFKAMGSTMEMNSKASKIIGKICLNFLFGFEKCLIAFFPLYLKNQPIF